jgi:hypothetical protein
MCSYLGSPSLLAVTLAFTHVWRTSCTAMWWTQVADFRIVVLESCRNFPPFATFSAVSRGLFSCWPLADHREDEVATEKRKVRPSSTELLTRSKRCLLGDFSVRPPSTFHSAPRQISQNLVFLEGSKQSLA